MMESESEPVANLGSHRSMITVFCIATFCLGWCLGFREGENEWLGISERAINTAESALAVEKTMERVNSRNEESLHNCFETIDKYKADMVQISAKLNALRYGRTSRVGGENKP